MIKPPELMETAGTSSENDAQYPPRGPKAAHTNFRILPPAVPNSRAFVAMMATETSQENPFGSPTRMSIETHASVTSWLDRVVSETWAPPSSVQDALLQSPISPMRPSTITFKTSLHSILCYRALGRTPREVPTRIFLLETIVTDLARESPPFFRLADFLHGVKITSVSSMASSPPDAMQAGANALEVDVFSSSRTFGYIPRFPNVPETGADDESGLALANNLIETDPPTNSKKSKQVTWAGDVKIFGEESEQE